MNKLSVEELLTQKKYNEVIIVLEERVDKFELVDLKEFLIWASCYEKKGDYESALHVLSIAYLEEYDSIQLDNEFDRIRTLQENVNQGIIQLGEGLTSSEEISLIKATFQSLIEHNVFDEALRIWEDIIVQLKGKDIGELWFGNIASNLFQKLDENVIMKLPTRKKLLDTVIYYYISTSKVYDANYQHALRLRQRSF
ncbi:hypothetical protein [Flammeovirga kamogawensis]|uniref:Tetratricopeptide repeat protein n=1 Tax=Flammeovirga kamogawensis TaxID=373891 RepID=A0ABX8GYH8_9BACT|nr:hypothetical protein [Flammeovirga kamogawensis]MBB6460800.1 tetratricopeptide (TPR) repeat protein [Flammeovirga kamogawensis]QWG08152.1 hypothetical protein KM029_04225 [Flammeovirga kamogawensis]TRX69955.1 hypothetical protein EO216_18165 [Flammeovirga kamogawensis]